LADLQRHVFVKATAKAITAVNEKAVSSGGFRREFSNSRIGATVSS